jgi:hypothetical protein
MRAEKEQIFMQNNFKFEITEHIAEIDTKEATSLQLNMVSWNDKPPKYDLRFWNVRDKDGMRAYKGICLDKEQLAKLREVLDEYLK